VVLRKSLREMESLLINQERCAAFAVAQAFI
jgi:hypothetical protein